MMGVILGAVAAGIVAWKWRDQIREYVEKNTRAARGTVTNELRDDATGGRDSSRGAFSSAADASAKQNRKETVSL